VTVNNLLTNISFLKKSTEANSSWCKKIKNSFFEEDSGEEGKGSYDWRERHLSPMALSKSLFASILLTGNGSLEKGVTLSMISRKTSNMEGARGTRL